MFVQYCLLPRCFSSRIDALYCNRFLTLMVEMSTPGFYLLHVCQHVVRSLLPVVKSCSANEASRYGLFLFEILSEVNRFVDRNTYEKETTNHVCFCQLPSDDDSKTKNESFDHSTFSRTHLGWHTNMTRNIHSVLIRGKPKMDIKNTLLVVSKLCGVYPLYKRHGVYVVQGLTKVKDDPRNKGTALQLLATRAHALQQKNEKNLLNSTTPRKASKRKAAVAPSNDQQSKSTTKSTSKSSNNSSSKSTTKSSTKPFKGFFFFFFF